MNSTSPTPTIDNSVAFANDLFLYGWVFPKSEPVAATLVDARGRRVKLNISRFKFYPRPDVKQALRQTSADDLYGFICAIELADLIGFALHDGDVEFTIEARDGHSVSGTVRVQSASSDRQSPEFHELLNLAAKLGLLPAKLANYVSGAGARRTEGHTRYAIDAACKSNSGFIMEGWIENARSRQLSFLSSDGLSYVAAADVIFRTRTDVSDHLRAEKCSVLTDDHGVVLNFPQCHSGTNSFVILAEEHDTFAPLAQIEATFSADRGRLLQVASQTGGIGKLPKPDQAKKLFRPFFVESESANEYSVLPIKAATSRPAVSIIVPFYGEYRFIFSLLTMQKRFSSDFEWIFVSDEPAKHQMLTQIVEKRSESLNCPTTVVLNRANYGFSRSNNIGTAVAQGDKLLFMNSDIWVDSARPLVNAAKALDTDRFQIIGFRLLFEDGTIQHEGMTFERSGFLHNLFVVEHPHKGTPPDGEVNKIVEVAAVTGALLMIKKDLFLKIGQFDRAFIKGDFEDADLCLKVRMNGGSIGLYKTDGVFHLERQSIRLMDENSARMALTYLNCITFNERWAKHISNDEARPLAVSPAVATDRRGKRMEA